MLRTLLSRLVFVSAALALGACDSADTPFEPAAEALIPDDQAPAPDLALATTAQRILFSSSRKGGYDLFKMDPQGYNVARMTSFANYETEPAWSQDNQRIAMTRPRLDASNVQHSDVYLMNADGTNKRWARSSPSSFDIRYPSWSPDGSRLVVNVMLAGKPYLATLKVATGAMAFVTLGGKVLQGSYPSFDPTGKFIVYIGASGKTIEMINPAGDTGYLMVSSTTFMSGPRISPDGYRIAFAKVMGSNIDIFVYTTNTGATKRLTTNAASDTEPTWSPDGSKIAFVSDRSGKSQIWTMNAATGGSQTRITHTSTHEKNPVWSH
jgi:Tol biopolymer transport system component